MSNSTNNHFLNYFKLLILIMIYSTILCTIHYSDSQIQVINKKYRSLFNFHNYLCNFFDFFSFFLLIFLLFQSPVFILFLSSHLFHIHLIHHLTSTKTIQWRGRRTQTTTKLSSSVFKLLSPLYAFPPFWIQSILIISAIH